MDLEFFLENATDVVLEIEINPNGADRFEARYELETGERPIVNRHYQHQPNKWGMECRVYFNSIHDLSDEFTSLDIYVEEGERPYRNNWTYRTNDREFFWELVHQGYRLGAN